MSRVSESLAGADGVQVCSANLLPGRHIRRPGLSPATPPSLLHSCASGVHSTEAAMHGPNLTAEPPECPWATKGWWHLHLK